MRGAAAARCSPTSFEDISAVGALYRPGPMGANAHNDYADRKNGRKPVDADPPRAGRAAGRDPRRDLRPDRLPGAGHGDRPEGGRLLPRRGRPAPPRDGQEEEGDPRQGVRGFRPACGATATPTSAIKTLWDILVPFSDYAFNKAHTAGYGAGLVLDRLPQGQLSRPSTWRRCSPRSATTRTSRRSTSPSAGAWASRCCRPTSTSPTAASPPVGDRHPLRPRRHPQRRRERRRGDRPAAARRRAASPTSTTSCARSTRSSATRDHRVADQGRRVRLARPHPPWPARRPRRRHRRRHGRSSATRRSASSTCSAAVERRRTGLRRSTPPIPAGEWDKRDLLAFEREMLGLYVSDHPLLGLEHVLAGAADMSVAALRRRGRVPTARSSPSPASCPASSAGSPSRARPGRRRPGGPGRRGRGACSSPNTYELVGQYVAEDAVVVVRGRVDRREEAPGVMASDLGVPDLAQHRSVPAAPPIPRPGSAASSAALGPPPSGRPLPGPPPSGPPPSGPPLFRLRRLRVRRLWVGRPGPPLGGGRPVRDGGRWCCRCRRSGARRRSCGGSGILARHPGDTEVQVELVNGARTDPPGDRPAVRDGLARLLAELPRARPVRRAAVRCPGSCPGGGPVRRWLPVRGRAGGGTGRARPPRRLAGWDGEHRPDRADRPAGSCPSRPRRRGAGHPAWRRCSA